MRFQSVPGPSSFFRPAAALLASVAFACLALSSSGRAQGGSEAVRHTRTQHLLAGRRTHAGASAARALDAARREQAAMLALPRASGLSAPWAAVGPAQVLSQSFGAVTGRVTSLALDPADPTGNTLYLGTTGGGVWKSTNAAGPAASVVFTPLTDTLPVFSANAGTSVIPSLSIGAVAVANGVVLAGTGDPNDASDSYYGAGILRSGDGGSTWTLAQGSLDGVAGNHSFFGLGVAGFAFSSTAPSLVVAALSQSAEGVLVNAADANNSVKGLYYSADAGTTWHMSVIEDGSQIVQTPEPSGGNNGGNAATAVVWNAARQRFYAAVQFHGYYESADGMTWTRLAHQPGAGLSLTACPTNPGLAGNPACPIFRGALAVQPATGDLFALTIATGDLDEGLYQDTCTLTGSSCANAIVQFGTRLGSSALEAGSGSTAIAQGDYNLALAAVPSGNDTALYAGTIDLFRCTLAGGCTLRNTTNAGNGCLTPAGVAPAQHALAALATSSGPLLFLGNDGGIYRSADGAAETGQACSATDASHFQNLNPSLGSLAEVVSFAQDPADPGILLTGLGALGTAGTGSAASTWPQLATGEGGTVAIDPATPANWYVSTNAGVSIARCGKGAGCMANDFLTTTIGEPQVANDIAAIHAPWLLDPAATANLLIGTCRAWRGPASNGALWSSGNAISRPFGAPSASGCGGTFPVVRSLAAGGPVSGAASAANAGSEVLYAGLAGSLDGGAGFGGHLFTTLAANLANSSTVWTDAARSPVSNDQASAGVFNPGGFDLSSVAVDPHDATGRTVYATVMGFAGNGVNAPHLYRSLDGGGHWTNISSNLPNAPANSVVVDPNDANTLYVALDTGVYVATQVGSCASTNCWSVFGAGLPNAPAIELEAASAMPTGDGRLGELRVATYGRGVWQIPLITAINPASPAIALNPSSVAFGTQQVGTLSPSVTVTVTNTGSASLTVASVATTGDFIATSNCLGSPIAQGASCSVQVSFEPSATGARAGLLTVYGNVPGGQATATLSGTGTPPASIVLTPTSLAFPATSVGATSAVENITISNTGGTPATLQTPAVSGDFKLAANTCAATLAPSTGCTLSIAFAPTVSGARTGTLTVVDSAGTQVASLTGTGTTPATDTLAPLSLSFAAQQLNTTSPAQTVTLTNAGDVALTLIAAQIASGDFTVTNGCGNSLNPHSSCNLAVTYIPKAVGNESGVLTVADQFRSQTVQLSGVGLAPPGVSLSPLAGLSFGAVGAGLTSTAQTVTLTNNGGVPLALQSVTVNGDFAIVAGTNTCGSSLAPAGVCTVGVSFLPTTAGARAGAITFVDNAANTPQTLALMGIGVDFTLAPDGASSMTVASGKTATYALLLSSAAGVPGSAGFTCSGVPAHTLCTVNPASANLGAASVVTVTVTTGSSMAALERPMLGPQLWPQPGTWLALLLPAGALAWRRRRVRLQSLLACACLWVALLAANGCATGRLVPSDGSGGGGGTGAPPVVTPSGTYTLTVAGSSAGLVRSVPLTLVVQ